jgi:8-oxo-dGTP diphosphatase
VKLVPVALAMFNRAPERGVLEIWTQIRTDGGPFQGLLEFPGGGIEAGETPLEAAVREVAEEVGIAVSPAEGVYLGTYANELPGRSILLYVFLFPPHPQLDQKGSWLRITQPGGSDQYRGQIPGPNHRMIEDLYALLLAKKTGP